MTVQEYWYCTRLELEREQSPPAYGRLIREALKLFHPRRFNRPLQKLPSNEFLFVIITENHLKHFRPVAAALENQRHSFSIIYTNHQLFQKYEGEWPGISFSSDALIGRRSYWRALRFQASLLLQHFFSGAAKKSSIIRFSKPTFLLHQALLRILPKCAEKVVLFKAESYQANAVLLASKTCGIPSFAIQHGLIGDTSQVSNLMVGHYLVWSALFQQRLERWEAGCEVLITGNAAYDAVFQEVAHSDAAALPALPLQILVLPSPGLSHTPLSEVYWLLDMAIGFARKNTEARITIKPHPADHSEHAKTYIGPHLAGCPNICVLERTDVIPFAEHHLIALNNSGAGMEACIWQRPMVVVATDWNQVMVKQYVDEGVAEFADNLEGFSRSVYAIQKKYSTYQENCRKFTQTQLAHPGRAAEKIVEVLTC